MGGIEVRTVTFESEIAKLKTFTIADRQGVKIVEFAVIPKLSFRQKV